MVGAEREMHTILLHGAPGVGAARTFGTEAVAGPALVIEQVRWLHGRDDIELAEAREIFGRDELRVFDAITAVAQTIRRDDCGESIEGDMVCAVAYRVEGELKSGAVAFD